MKCFLIVPFALISMTSLAIANPLETEPTVSREAVIDAPAEEIWAAYGQFCSLTEWQSLVAACEVTQKADGIYRTAVMTDDTAYVERLIFYSDESMAFGYSMLSGPAPVTDYVALFDIDPVDAQKSVVRISAWYGVTSDATHEVVDELLIGLFENGLSGISALLSN